MLTILLKNFSLLSFKKFNKMLVFKYHFIMLKLVTQGILRKRLHNVDYVWPDPIYSLLAA